MDAGHGTAAQETDDDAPHKKKTAARKSAGPRALSPAAPPEDVGKDAALAECAVSCCIFCACLPVAALFCVARAAVLAVEGDVEDLVAPLWRSPQAVFILPK